MPRLFSRFLIATPIFLASLYSHPSISVAQPLERVTFQLNGPRCNVQHANILSALSPLPGVQAVDLSSVPGHALIDIDTETLSAQNLVEKVLRMWHEDAGCRVEQMQSCISADPFSHIGHASTNHAAMVR